MYPGSNLILNVNLILESDYILLAMQAFWNFVKYEDASDVDKICNNNNDDVTITLMTMVMIW